MLSASIPNPPSHVMPVSPAGRASRIRNVVDKPVCCMVETCLALRDGGSQQEPKAGKREGAETKELAHAITGQTDQAAWKGKPKVLRLPGCG